MLCVMCHQILAIKEHCLLALLLSLEIHPPCCRPEVRVKPYPAQPASAHHECAKVIELQLYGMQGRP